LTPKNDLKKTLNKLQTLQFENTHGIKLMLMEATSILATKGVRKGGFWGNNLA